MLKDSSNQRNVDKQEVAAAIAQLKEKNWDINAYTVADELHVQRSMLYRNSELMDLITEARSQGGHTSDILPEQAIKRATQLEQMNQELEERAHRLENELSELGEQVQGAQEAWHLGHKAGFEEGMRQAKQEAHENEMEQGLKVYDSDKELVEHGSAQGSAQGPTPGPAPDAPTPSEEPLPQLLLPSSEERPLAETRAASEDLPWAERPFMTGILDELVQKEFVPGEKTDSEYLAAEESELLEGLDMFTAMQPGAGATPASDKGHESEPVEDEEKESEPISQEELAELLKKKREKDASTTGSFSKVSDSGSNPGLAGAKFISASKSGAESASHRAYSPAVPPPVRKACLMLGIRPEDMTVQLVHEAWKKEITRPGTHPDHGGDTEMAMYLNTAKDVLLRWLETQEPKLGKKFGAAFREGHKQGPSEENEEPGQPS